ncbi:hypothetical protein [Variovorax sp. PCZ-1]|uniref:FFLEELY motif protein n=1 Tax=Variovorax sp. PCZ-1 TaxID=2835533 RepID=UPI001BCD4B3D|nr:hypothetical protein [Variovorax sp. PCZ-1]MBS7808980.1 hypothetical protein [Variovorax sp. PCZ-1]
MPRMLTLPTIRNLEAYGTIAQALSVVEHLRKQRHTHPELAKRTESLRQWQAQRFRNTYTDVLKDPHMGPAALFFLTELYSEQDFSKRDAQFARIAGAIERLFPQAVVQTATLLAKLHALSETLDACMAIQWLDQAKENDDLNLNIYQSLWQSLMNVPGYAQARQQQLHATQDLGLQLQRHTKVPGLRFMLTMMRAPATAAGLQDLQRFLERGFDTFGQLGKAGKVPKFLAIVSEREAAWLAKMAA